MDDDRFKNYTKTAVQPMREYVLGEDMSAVSVAECDTVEEGGMVAINPQNPADQWYVAKDYFHDNYQPA